ALFERGRRAVVSLALRDDASGASTPDLLQELLPDAWVETFGPSQMEAVRARLAQLPEPPSPRVQGDDLLGGAAVCFLVIATTVPVALPFLVLEDARTAMVVSRTLSLVLLFLGGYAVGRYAGLRPVVLGLTMLGIGGILVAVVPALGGCPVPSGRGPRSCLSCFRGARSPCLRHTRRRNGTGPSTRRSAGTSCQTRRTIPSPRSRLTAVRCTSRPATTTRRSGPSRSSSAGTLSSGRRSPSR